jgi:hypothetical protein
LARVGNHCISSRADTSIRPNNDRDDRDDRDNNDRDDHDDIIAITVGANRRVGPYR